MSSKASCKKILVIMNPELIESPDPLESALLKRAIAFSKDRGCELELFHVAYDSALEYQLFKSGDEFERLRQERLDNDATKLAEIAAWLVQRGIAVEHEVRWDYPRADAILRKVARSEPDFVMKRQQKHGFFLGITTNTDWELARRATANLWLVHDATDRIDALIAAVGNRMGRPGDVTADIDHTLLTTAIDVGKACNARVLAVNAYELPDVTNYIANAGDTMMPVQSTRDHEKTRSRIVARHSEHVRALTDNVGIGQQDIYLREGHPATVIPEVAKEVGAGLIVMGANSIGRLERIVRPVTVEPVMANAGCDILIVRGEITDDVPGVAKRTAKGEPRYDLEYAITHPDDTFESPQQVANLSEISVDLRKRILQAWEYDIRAEMREQNEGGPVREVDADALDQILSAKALLDMKTGRGAAAGSD